MLTIPLDRIAAIILAAREREAEEKRAVSRKSGGRPSTAAADSLLDLVAGLTGEELNELTALAWMGRGDFEPDAFPEALRQAAEIISTHPAEYVAHLTGLAHYLRSALASLGYHVKTLRGPG